MNKFGLCAVSCYLFTRFATLPFMLSRLPLSLYSYFSFLLLTYKEIQVNTALWTPSSSPHRNVDSHTKLRRNHLWLNWLLKLIKSGGHRRQFTVASEDSINCPLSEMCGGFFFLFFFFLPSKRVQQPTFTVCQTISAFSKLEESSSSRFSRVLSRLFDYASPFPLLSFFALKVFRGLICGLRLIIQTWLYTSHTSIPTWIRGQSQALPTNWPFCNSHSSVTQ